MELLLQRDPGEKDRTFGTLHVNGQRFCYTLEDEYRAVKVPGETRIPAGIYEIRLRAEGGMSPRYAARFPFHRGMLWLQAVPGFEYVYIHIGNTDDDTQGCILVGIVRTDEGLGRSTEAYVELYQNVLAAMDAGERVWIVVRDR